jgi:serine/threonine protein kinase
VSIVSTPVLRGSEDIGPYQILEDLGPAPFGTVHSAVDTRADRLVTLKVIPPSRPGSWQEIVPWEILLDETRALARIYHRGLPVIYDLGEYEGALLVAFEPVDGRSLHDLLRRGRRPDRGQLVEWGCQLLDVLEEAHGAGVLHRHLCEDEILLAPGGRLFLTGFGLTQTVFGPPLPVAPEQLAGGPLTPATDIYAVGSLLRRLTFAGALKGRGAGRDPLFKVLARATCTDPHARYGSAREMSEALREADRLGWLAFGAPASLASCAASRRAEPQAAHELGSVVRLARFPERGRAEPERDAEKEDRDLWRALVLVISTLLLLAFVVATGWIVIERQRALEVEADPAAAASTVALPPDS